MRRQVLGTVSKEVAQTNNLEEYVNKKIVLYDNDRRHCEKRHLKDFKNPDDFYYIMDHLNLIIDNPDCTYYVANKNTLEYYKYIRELDVTIRIRVEPGNTLKMKTMFISKKSTIDNRENNKYYNMYVKNIREN